MKVKNNSCINGLSFRQFKAAKTRNLIAVSAIALTTLLFTALFTISLSINSSFEEYQFRQCGGYCHGTFKDLDAEKIEAIAGHKKVKEYGLRTVCGTITDPPFAKIFAELSWMDANCTKWSYAAPTMGRMPESGMEIAMDTTALEKLGIPAELGANVTLTYLVGLDGGQTERTDHFTLVGFWEYDQLMPVHYLNVSEEYVRQVNEDYVSSGGSAFRTDMNIMLASSINIREVMEGIDTDLGYQWEDREADDCARIGVNWGYSASELGSNMDPTVIFAIIIFVLLVTFTGYLIIYNIFRISVSSDVRFYGLLKTIGTTPKQLKQMIRYQALLLSAIGTPIGFLLGYGVGSILTPTIMQTATTMGEVVKISANPTIFLFSGLFSLFTVLLSCKRPGRMAAGISPIEAVRYTEGKPTGKKRRRTKGASLSQMAFAGLGRSKTKTALVIISLSLAVILLNCVYTFTNGFDMEKYVSHSLPADFITGTTDYFQYNGHNPDSAIPQEVIDEIKANTSASLMGSGYGSDTGLCCWVPEQMWRSGMKSYLGDELLETALGNWEKRGDLVKMRLMLEGMDESLLEKLTVVEGDIAPLLDPDSHNIAIALPVDDYGDIIGSDYPEVGSKLPVTYIEESDLYDSRTGEPYDESTPAEYVVYRISKGHDVEYTVCALVGVPFGMGYRFGHDGFDAVLTKEALAREAGVYPLYFCFDADDDAAEAQAEAFLADYTAGETSGLNYQSKNTLRNEFEGFRNMFLLMGGVLSFVVGLIGILNFFNAILTGILSRRREFAMLQSVGMTGKQLLTMLVYEGLCYAGGAILFSLALSVLVEPFAGRLMESTFWFFSFRFTLAPVIVVAPVFILLGAVLPLIIYRFTARKSIVERLRENE